MPYGGACVRWALAVLLVVLANDWASARGGRGGPGGGPPGRSAGPSADPFPPRRKELLRNGPVPDMARRDVPPFAWPAPYPRAPYRRFDEPAYVPAYTYPAVSAPAVYQPRPVAAVAKPSAKPAARTPTPASTPTPVRPLTLRETAAAHFYAQAREAAWDVYENYEESLSYDVAYRDFHRLLQLAKGVSKSAAAAGDEASPELARPLHEIELLLTVVQAQTTGWTRDPGAEPGPLDADIQTQVERMSSTLGELMAAFQVAPQDFAAAEEPATTIHARQ